MPVPVRCVHYMKPASCNTAWVIRRGVCPSGQHRLQRLIVRCERRSGEEQDGSAQQGAYKVVLPVAALALSAAATLALTVFREPLEDLVYASDFGSAAGLGPGDLFGGLLWSLSLYYVSPLQLLLLFLGKLETDRPSDWLTYQLGRAAGLPVNDVSYSAPTSIRAAVVLTCLLSGLFISWALGAGLGDATWAVSTGLGSCLAAGVYEVGRPRRLDPAQAQKLEAQWQDFASFANARLQRTGRCHESEVFTAFRRTSGRYRSKDTLPDDVLRDMVRNWHPDADRTPNGFYRNLSLLPYTDAFTGQQRGSNSEASVQDPGAAVELQSVGE